MRVGGWGWGKGRLVGVVGVAVVLLLLAGLGGVALVRVGWARAEVVELDGRNVERLAVLGEIRGQQDRINDGVAYLVAPDADGEGVAGAKSRTGRALEDMDRLMLQYRRLVGGTAAAADFGRKRVK